ncbi:Clp protease N-terminal domain-containing protein [Microbacterium rhizophilus]|uniref:Clp protease N-terminal domain-containing protein n=1 Tax=Microbacterium rhizophilus TaxID=3138934 RepID=UPI0031EA51D2
MADQFPFPDSATNMRLVGMAAVVEAQRQGLVSVEAEHILLALAADAHSPAGQFLVQHGLDHGALLAALRTERERSLGVVGVAPRDPATLAATRIGRPRFGASARNAFDRAQKFTARARRGWHRMNAFDLLGGVFELEIGTVPRALAYAGIDREALLAEIAERAAPDSG